MKVMRSRTANAAALGAELEITWAGTQTGELLAPTGDQISGVVTAGSTGISGAVITVVGNGTVYTAHSNLNGAYSITGLADGTYNLYVTAPGWAQGM